MHVTRKDIPPPTTLDFSNFVNHRPLRFRFLRAFWGTARIVISIGIFHLPGKFLGAEWKNSKQPEVYRQNAHRLKRLILSLKGIFIKAGQLISILSNFVTTYTEISLKPELLRKMRDHA